MPSVYNLLLAIFPVARIAHPLQSHDSVLSIRAAAAEAHVHASQHQRALLSPRAPSPKPIETPVPISPNSPMDYLRVQTCSSPIRLLALSSSASVQAFSLDIR